MNYADMMKNLNGMVEFHRQHVHAPLHAHDVGFLASIAVMLAKAETYLTFASGQTVFALDGTALIEA